MVKCILKCDTGRKFAVDIELLKKSKVLDNMMKTLDIGQNPDVELDEEELPLTDISEMCMEKLIEWLEYHKEDAEPSGGADDFQFKDHISEWDREFLQIDDATLFGLIMAANYLEIRSLLDVTTTYVAKIIADLDSPEDIRKRFNIKNDLTPEDLEKIKEESRTWLDDDDDDEEEEEVEGATGGAEAMETTDEPQPSTSGAASSSRR